MSATNKEEHDVPITNQTTVAENDIPSEPGTRDSSPILNLDDWAGEDPFARPYEFEQLVANPTSTTNRILNTSEENERLQAIFADNTALESYAPALLSRARPTLPSDTAQPPVPTNRNSRKRGAPEGSFSSSSNRDSIPEHEGGSGNGDNVSGSSFSRRKKKAKGMPKRPLSAYNLYFQAQRTKIIAERQGFGDDERGIGFEELGKIVGRLWRELGNAEKKVYEKLAEKDGERYRKEMDAYHEMKNKLYEEEANRPLSTASFPLVAAPVTDRSNFAMGAPLTNPMFDSYKFHPPLRHSRSTSSTSSPGLSHGQFSASRGSTSEPVGQAPSVTLSYDGMGSAPSNGSEHLSPAQGLRPTTSLGAPAPTPPPVMHSHASHQGQHSMRGPPAGPSPMSFDHSNGNDSSDHFPLPPGMEIVLSDCNGVDRKYRVHYQCFSMTREAAHRYMESLSGVSAPFSNDYPIRNHPTSMPDANARMPPPTPTPVQDGSQSLMSHQHYNGGWRF
jgi:hypothetical protein